MKRKELTQFATSLAQAAGIVLRKYWGNLSEIQEKSHAGDLVTEADKESESVIISKINAHYPTHAILAEESGAIGKKQSEYLWVIDPVDGTTNYAHQYPFVSISIGLMHNQIPIVGVVYNPIYEELFVAAKGEGAFFNGRPIRVSQVNRLSKSLLATGFPYNRRETKDNNYPEFYHLTSVSQGVRRQGSAALDLANVACGRLDGFWEQGLQPWDSLAGIVLIEEAGGRITNYKGEPFDIYSHKILATNGLIHQEMIDALGGV